MLLNATEHRKQDLSEEIEVLRLELAGLYKEKDRVLDEIRDQRTGKTIVHTETEVKKAELYTIEDILKETSIQLAKSQKNFYDLTDNQKDSILELNKNINSKLFELEEYDKKELIDIDGLNLGFKEEITAKRTELENVKVEMKGVQKEMADFEKYKIKESKRLQKITDKQEKLKKALTKKNTALNRQEKRAKKLILENNQTNNGSL